MNRSFFCILIVVLFISCDKEHKPIRIGLSQINCIDDWRKNMNEEMIREIGFYPDLKIDFIIKNANDNSAKQKQDILDLCKQDIDILIVSPNEAEPLTQVVSEVYNKGIPVILVDRKINSDKYTAFVGGDNYQIGIEAGKYAVHLLHEKGNILEIKGLKGATPANERSNGFSEIVRQYPNVKIIKSIYGNWLKERAQLLTDSLLKAESGLKIDLVYAHNDFMALGAYNACTRNKIRPKILGVDGLAVPNCGVDMVLNHNIDATFPYPSGGEIAIRIAIDIIQHKHFEKENIIQNTFPIDINNARTLKVQYKLLIDQQAKIDKQRLRMSKMTELIKQQKIFLFLSLVIISLMIVVIALIIFFLSQKEKANQLIRDHEKHIHRQMEELQELSSQLIEKNATLKNQNEEILTQKESIENKNEILLEQSEELRKINTLLKERQLKIEEKNSLLIAQTDFLNNTNTLLEESQQQIEEQSEELTVQRDQLGQLNATKDKLFSILAHDLRNPFQAVMGFSELLLNDFEKLSAEKIQKFLGLIHSSSIRGNDLLENILQWSRTQTGSISYEPEELYLTKVAEETKNLLEGDAQRKNITINQLIDPKIVVKGDENMLKTIFRNLISNAIKFTPEEGNITLRAEVSINSAFVEVAISDTGVGISDVILKNIFRVDTTFTTRGTAQEAGTGLGLVICMEFVKKHNGKIWIKSLENKGTTIYFTLPTKIDAQDITAFS